MSILTRMALQALQVTWRALAMPSRWSRPFPIVLEPGSPPVFPDPSGSGAEGLIAIGGDLSPDRLLAAYRAGIFPWFDDEGPILWWSPDPRAIFTAGSLHVSHRLARTVRSGKFSFTLDRAFPQVLHGCADRDEGTWITPEMAAAYEELHRRGHAHSLEVWHEGSLAGGIYGVSMGGLFAGESMFTHVRDASKVALVYLTAHLQQRGYSLFDIQMLTPHTASLGALEISRAEYLRRLREALSARDVTFT